MSWAHNPALSSPPFLLTAFMIIIFTHNSKWRPAGLGPLEGSCGSAFTREARGAVRRRLGHRGLYMETNSTLTSWELGERCLGVEGARVVNGTPCPPPLCSGEAPGPRQVGNVRCTKWTPIDT